MNKMIIISLVGLLAILLGCDDDGVDIVISPGTVLEPNVGGNDQPNQVYVDLSTESLTDIRRDSWDLAFYTGDEFRVFLNPSVNMLAYKTGKTDINSVTSADSAGLGEMLDFDIILVAAFSGEPWTIQSTDWVDNPDGTLTDTALDAVDASDANNFVYILNRGKSPEGNDRGWVRLRVIRQGTDAYQLEVGEFDSNAVMLTITKNPESNFVFVHLENGIVNGEPPKNNWDIAFTTYVQLEFAPAISNVIPLGVRDNVIINRNNVSVYENILPSGSDLVAAFESFSIADVDETLFNEAVNAIGGNWRTVFNPNVPGSTNMVKSDRFYVIKDPDGNFYKLLFTRMLNNLGERGHPEFQYLLVQ